MKKMIKGRKMRYGSVTVVLTLLITAALVIVNVISGALAGRFDWMFIDMNSHAVYDISEECKDYLSAFVIPEVDRTNEQRANDGEKKLSLEIIFCDEKENIEKELSQKYIHDSVRELETLFAGYFDISYLNIWENPTYAHSLGVSSTSDVVCRFGDRTHAVNLEDFYIFEGNNSSPVAYNGEKILASCLMRVTQKDEPMCYFTANHGETLEDYELVRAIVEAGYTVSFLDLSSDGIPEDCELLVTYEPKQDFIVSDGVSSVSECDELQRYMNNGGKYLVFASADTFVSGERANFEAFLAEWGVGFKHQKGNDGIENCYLIKDSSNSLTVDGYTVVSRNSKVGLGGEVMADIADRNVFANSTCIYFADGFEYDGDGNYVAIINGNERIVSPLMTTYESAEAWAGGRAVARAASDPFVLMSISQQMTLSGEKAVLVASASSEFANEAAMQSSVIGNNRALTGLLKYFGRENAPVDLVFKPFGGDEIETLTTKTANTLTAVLTVLPAIIIAAVGTVILVRRKNR
jgi:hypothetical protein